MKFDKFVPEYYLYTDDNELLHIMIAYSSKQGGKAVFSVLVDPDTKRYLGNIVESRIRAGYNDSPCFERHKKRYYLAWLKPIPKRVDKK